MCFAIAAILQSSLALPMSMPSMLCEDGDAVAAESEWWWLCCANARVDVVITVAATSAAFGKNFRTMETQTVGVCIYTP